jgi:ectoine hydroxylase-related dioxygenase (phytanoyl-CoA dioxygenase family)
MIPRFKAGQDEHQWANALLEVGAIIIEQAATEATIDAFNRDLQPEYERVGAEFQNDFNGYRTRRVGGIAQHSAEFQTLFTHPYAMALADAVLGSRCEVIRVGSTTAIEILPGEDAQVLHADDTIYPKEYLPFEVQISVLWALDDFTEENGATRVIPGSHLNGPHSNDPKQPSYPAAMPRGSMVVYLGSTLHGGGANHSDKPRKALVNTYTLGWLRQEENQYLTLPSEAVAVQPENVRRLLGFQAHGPNLGVWPEDPDGKWFES